LKSGHPGQIVIGVDEVGRGCLAGPVVAAAVVLPEKIDLEAHPWLLEVTDSKLVPPKKREELFLKIQAWAKAYAIASASVDEIDAINIFQASHLAMMRAIAKTAVAPDHVLVDGKFKPKDLKCDSTAIIKGDQKCLSIACASILAKVWRDQLMTELDAQHPGYGFGVHKGYSTPVHARAIQALGVTAQHRRSFGPVKAALGLESEKRTGAPIQR
jgi:ribonuclease HII